MKKFNNLHVHSVYSTLDAVSLVEDVVDFSVNNDLTCACLTEHGTLASAYKLWTECNEKNITPILGIEAYYVDNLHCAEALQKHCYNHMCLYCKNETGWNNLKELQLKAWKEGFYSKPRISYESLREHAEGLIMSTACIGGVLNAPALKLKYWDLQTDKVIAKTIDKRIKRFKRLFKDDFYGEIMLNDLPEQVDANKNIIKLAKKYKFKVIVTNDSHYVNKEDADLHDIIKCKSRQKTLTDPDNGTYDTKDLYLLKRDDLERLRRKNHKYIKRVALNRYADNTVEIENKVEKYAIRTSESALPKFCEDSKGELLKKCDLGRKRLKRMLKEFKWDKTYQKRLDYELGVINKLGMADYFLIVCDIMDEARKRHIACNTRGSVAGSLVAYVMDISKVDPLIFGTTFERFLTEDRISLPDIDMDFAKSRRVEMIDYLRHKYGDECVAHIVSFNIYKPKSAIKDVAKVCGVPYKETNDMTKLIPDGTEEWDDIPDEGKIAEYFDKHEEVEGYARRTLDIINARGVHASGVVLTPSNSMLWTPVAWSQVGGDDGDRKDRITEFDMYHLEEMDVLKLDFLGQNTLDIIQDTVDLIGDKNIKDFDELFAVLMSDLDNGQVYKAVAEGDLIGTFQLGTSEGMRKLAMDMKCTRIDDIIALVALYRSAVLQINAHTRYVNRKHGLEEIKYIHTDMAEVLDDTYGIFLFQEQIMEMAVHLAGFTRTESDHFRKAIKLKDAVKFGKWKDKFVEGCDKHSSIKKKQADAIWDEMKKWSSYGFNRSHAVIFGLVAYMTVWLKVKYPTEYFTALLSRNAGDDDKLTAYIKDARKKGVKFLKPHINNSSDMFKKLTSNKIQYPFTVVKGLGEKIIENLLSARKDGKYKNFQDFYDRVNKRVINKGVMQKLIFAGCFRKYGSVNEMFNMFLDTHKDKYSCNAVYCISCRKKYPVSIVMKKALSDGVVCPECGDVNTNCDQKLIRDKDFNDVYCNNLVYGFTMSNPLKPYLGEFINKSAIKVTDMKRYDVGDRITIGAIVSKIKKWVDKNGNDMAFLQLTDGDSNYDCVVFSKEWVRVSSLLEKGRVYIMDVEKSTDEGFIFSRSGTCDKLLLKG